MFNTHTGRLRITGYIEGVSYIALVFVAMPLKYIWDQPQMVRQVGMAHGVLFIVYVLAIAPPMIRNKWSTLWTLKVFSASLIPFGPLLIDKGLKKYIAEELEKNTSKKSIKPPAKCPSGSKIMNTNNPLFASQ